MLTFIPLASSPGSILSRSLCRALDHLFPVLFGLLGLVWAVEPCVTLCGLR